MSGLRNIKTLCEFNFLPIFLGLGEPGAALRRCFTCRNVRHRFSCFVYCNIVFFVEFLCVQCLYDLAARGSPENFLHF